jgi:hypothetical protein
MEHKLVYSNYDLRLVCVSGEDTPAEAVVYAWYFRDENTVSIYAENKKYF